MAQFPHTCIYKQHTPRHANTVTKAFPVFGVDPGFVWAEAYTVRRLFEEKHDTSTNREQDMNVNIILFEIINPNKLKYKLAISQTLQHSKNYILLLILISCLTHLHFLAACPLSLHMHQFLNLFCRDNRKLTQASVVY